MEAVVIVEWCLGDGISKHPSAQLLDVIKIRKHHHNLN